MTVLKIERTFAVEPERAFAFVTQMDNLLKWWGPEGTKIAEHNLDLSRPGPWWFVLVDPQGGRHRVSGTVLAVDPPSSVEFTLIVPSENGVRGIDSVVRFEVSPDGTGGTHFLFIQSGLTDDQLAEGSKQGWVSTLRRLERLLT